MREPIEHIEEELISEEDGSRLTHQRVFGILHTRTLEENREFYRITTIFLTLLIGIAGFGFSFEDKATFIFAIGFAVSIIWFFAAMFQVMWKRWWQGRYEVVEKIVFSTKQLRAMRETGLTKTPRIFGIRVRLTFVLLLFPAMFTCVSLLGLGADPWHFSIVVFQVLLTLYACYWYKPFPTS